MPGGSPSGEDAPAGELLPDRNTMMYSKEKFP